ncbi:hypothetical protein H696_01217 [Fonticula alba]|uniref:Uncharacterized protein n=1 Tax=Fonticula alba TaxID=691883 RepID=A0A058ZBM2_FONAL|nr:hypothetical protein H696_01217 [Fonticula alba]KCV71799.1 hypothetical protein H696_01217 [Fonticula alba]|eukprot:XP_009493377.1 hypothetical protein H696_01217 [Fonticula alba]
MPACWPNAPITTHLVLPPPLPPFPSSLALPVPLSRLRDRCHTTQAPTRSPMFFTEPEFLDGLERYLHASALAEPEGRAPALYKAFAQYKLANATFKSICQSQQKRRQVQFAASLAQWAKEHPRHSPKELEKAVHERLVFFFFS